MNPPARRSGGGAGGTAREAILAAVRRAGVPEAPLPGVPAEPARGPAGSEPVQLEMPLAPAPGAPAEADLVGRFVAALEDAGGTAVEMPLAALTVEAPTVGPRRSVVSCVAGLPISTLTIGPDTSRERLDEIAVAVVPARFGVAENGAVWVDERDLPHRAVPFIAERLVVVLPKREIVPDLHHAYRRLRPPLPGYGVFIAGPSKTADIEQALVIGAQGPKSLLVVLT